MTKSEFLKVLDAVEEEGGYDYGTAPTAVKEVTVAAFNFMASELGITGFQAGFAQMEVIRELLALESGFRIVDYDKLLYPQYTNARYFPTIEGLLEEPRIRKHVRAKAQRLLKEAPTAADKVLAHWKKLSDMPVLQEEEEDGG